MGMKLLTQKDVADMLSVSQPTVSRMCKHGDLPFIVLKAGRRKKVIRFRVEDVEKWITKKTSTGVANRRSARNELLNGNGKATGDGDAPQVGDGKRVVSSSVD
jgi:excisionase family DNA binding protein